MEFKGSGEGTRGPRDGGGGLEDASAREWGSPFEAFSEEDEEIFEELRELPSDPEAVEALFLKYPELRLSRSKLEAGEEAALEVDPRAVEALFLKYPELRLAWSARERGKEAAGEGGAQWLEQPAEPLTDLKKGAKEVSEAPSAVPPKDGPLPGVDKAVMDERKFTKYSMDPNNLKNRGKWKAWNDLGYDVTNEQSRHIAAREVIEQLRTQLPQATAKAGKLTDWGPRYEVRTEIVGPNGTKGTLMTFWQVDQDSGPARMITNWLEVHR